MNQHSKCVPLSQSILNLIFDSLKVFFLVTLSKVKLKKKTVFSQSYNVLTLCLFVINDKEGKHIVRLLIEKLSVIVKSKSITLAIAGTILKYRHSISTKNILG